MSSWRAKWGVRVVAAASVLGAAHSYHVSSQAPVAAADPNGVDAGARRFEGVRSSLPGRGEIGYLSDLPINDPVGTPAFVVAQYSLAPRLLVPVENGRRPSVAIGNFSRLLDYSLYGDRAG